MQRFKTGGIESGFGEIPDRFTLRGESLFLGNNATLAVNDYSVRDATHAEFLGEVIWVEHRGESVLIIGHEVFHGLGGITTDRKDDEALVFESRVEAVGKRQSGAAGRAPRGPKVDEDHLATQLR